MTRGLMVHGRFQPFHNEHLDYVLEGVRRTNGRVVIGVTNPFPIHAPEGADDADPERSAPSANPYSFDQRARMIDLSLRASAIDIARVEIVPFNLDALEDNAHLYADVAQLVNVQELWDAEKIRRFTAAGFEVVTYYRERTISGTCVRDRIRAGLSVEALVPAGTLEVLQQADHAAVPACAGTLSRATFRF